MKINILKIGWVLIAAFFVFLLFAVLFAVLVPMNFYVTETGRIEPAKVLRVSFPEDGMISFVSRNESFKKGDILAAQDATHEKELLENLKKQRRLMQAELEALIQRFEVEKCKWELEQKKCLMTLKKIMDEIPMQQGQLKMFSTISDSLRTQKKLDEELKKQEAEIFESLYKKQLVAKIDFLKVLHDKKIAEIMSEQAKAQTAEKLFDYKIELGKLAFEAELKKLEKKYLEKPMPPDTAQLKAKLEIQRLDAETQTLEEKMKNRIFRAPFDGFALINRLKKGEFLPKGQPVMEIAERSNMVFRATTSQFFRSDLQSGQKAEIYLDNFPHIKYGYIDGKLVDIQTNLSGVSTSYPLVISMNVPFEKYAPGLSGKAKIIIFRGTILNYLLRDNFIKKQEN